MRDDQLIFVEEHIADGHCFIEQAAGVAAHVEDEAIELRGVELLEAFGNFTVCGFVEAGEANVADAGLEQEGDVHGMSRNFVARYGEDQRLGITFAGHGDFYDCALGTFEEVGNFTGGEAVGGFFIDLYDDVTGAEASIVGGCANVRGHNHGMIFTRGYDHADAVIFATLIFAEQRKLLGIKEIGMRVKHAQHAGNGALVDGLVYVDGLGVIVLNHVEDAGEIVHGGLVIVGRGTGGTDVRSVNGSEDCT